MRASTLIKTSGAARVSDQGRDAWINAEIKRVNAEFIGRKAFEGAKPGYVFKYDRRGLGYYRDVRGIALKHGDEEATRRKFDVFEWPEYVSNHDGYGFLANASGSCVPRKSVLSLCIK